LLGARAAAPRRRRWAVGLMAVWRVAGANAPSVALTVGSGRYVFTVSQEE
jgi:hypothetical protein